VASFRGFVLCIKNDNKIYIGNEEVKTGNLTTSAVYGILVTRGEHDNGKRHPKRREDVRSRMG
jgi:hypothetical protein